jgi:hypothetical protein
MKIYRGTPGDPPKVIVEDGDGIRMLAPNPYHPFAWGDGSVGAADLARAIIADVTGDDREALNLMMRVKHRVVATWTAGEPWTITDAEIRGVIEEIRKIERETSQIRAMVAREPRPVVNEGGGVGWKSAPDIVPNRLPRDPPKIVWSQLTAKDVIGMVPDNMVLSHVDGLVPGRAYDELGILSVPCMVPPDSPFSVENLRKNKAKET